MKIERLVNGNLRIDGWEIEPPAPDPVSLPPMRAMTLDGRDVVIFGNGDVIERTPTRAEAGAELWALVCSGEAPDVRAALKLRPQLAKIYNA